MGYQESWFYMEPQRKFDKLIRAYERAESAGYYRVAGARAVLCGDTQAALRGCACRVKGAVGVR